MMRGKDRYSPDNRQDRRYPPRREGGYSPGNRRNERFFPPHGSRQGGLRERRDYGRDLEGDRDKRLVEVSRYDKDMRRRDDRSDRLERVNIDAKMGSEYPSGSMEGRDYRRHVDEDRDRHFQKMSPLHRESPYGMFQGEREGITSNSSRSSKYFLEYGGTEGDSERNYPGRGSEGLGNPRMMLEKSEYPSKDVRFSTYTSQSSNKRSYQDHGDDGSYLPSKKFSGEEIRMRGDLSRGKHYGDRPESYSREGEIPRIYSKNVTTDLYTREEENPRFHSRNEKPQSYSREGKSHLYLGEEKPYLPYRERESEYSLKDTLHHEIPLTQYKTSNMDPFASSGNDLNRSYKDNLVVSSDGYNRSSGYLTNPLPTEYAKSVVETQIDYGYPTARRSDYTETVLLSDKSYGKLSMNKNVSRYTDLLGARNMDPSLAGSGSRREPLAEERQWDDHRSPLDRIVSSYLDVSKSSYRIGSNLEGLGRREMDLGYEEEAYHSHENRNSKENYDYGQDEGLLPHGEERSSSLRDDYLYGQNANIRDRREYSNMPNNYNNDFDRVDQVFPGDYVNPLQVVKAEDVDMLTQSNDVFKRRRDISERLSINRKVFKKARDFGSSKLTLGGPRYRKPSVSYGIAQSRFKGHEAEGSSVGKARILNPGVRDIKKRLGPARPVKHTIVKPSIKKQKNWNVSRKNEDDNGDGSVKAEEGGPSENIIIKTKSEPPEKSEEFKQLVRNAFFKFVKQLNENVVEHKKFKEQGKAGSLKCWVCGSDSEEFQDTESLVKHACSATNVGLRSQHLGFHKALCSVMGWKAADIHNDEWVCEASSVAEIASLKKDLILWPPLVIVHNSSIEKSNPDGQVAVSIEDLETMIKDMGFGEKTKVCRGKPVNQSVMVVKFSATYSGFQEAERLQKFFASNKHGRNDFLKIKAKGPVNNKDKEKASADNMKDVLYGFMGISRDLNKLDSETKKRCVVRSKKEIQDLGDSPLKAVQE